MRYCPNCKKMVGTKFTVGQIVLLLILLCCCLIPGIIYAIVHSKKCPICGAKTLASKPNSKEK